jgi:regulatory protein YycI of two-component signal transduction system YycFG
MKHVIYIATTVLLSAVIIVQAISLHKAIDQSQNSLILAQQFEALDKVDQGNEARCISYLKEANQIISYYQ